MSSASDVVRACAGRLERIVRERGATLRLHLDARHDLEAPHLDEAVVAMLLALARHAAPGADLVVATTDRAGGDAEVIVRGLALPEAFPDGDENEDLWRFAEAFVREHHRARLANHLDAMTLLLPHGERAERLRTGQARRPGERAGTPG